MTSTLPGEPTYIHPEKPRRHQRLRENWHLHREDHRLNIGVGAAALPQGSAIPVAVFNASTKNKQPQYCTGYRQLELIRAVHT
eukprot:5526067-Pyramimonas_sp.AAC.1